MRIIKKGKYGEKGLHALKWVVFSCITCFCGTWSQQDVRLISGDWLIMRWTFVVKWWNMTRGLFTLSISSMYKQSFHICQRCFLSLLKVSWIKLQWRPEGHTGLIVLWGRTGAAIKIKASSQDFWTPASPSMVNDTIQKVVHLDVSSPHLHYYIILHHISW